MTRRSWYIGFGLAALLCGLVIGASEQDARAEQGGWPIGPDTAGFDTYVCSAVGGCNDIFGGPAKVAGFKFIAREANVECALFNALTVPLVESTTNKDEIREPTSGDTNTHIWLASINFSTGVSVGISGATGGTCIIYRL